jgi:Ca-activated chloride channel family protein
MKIDANDPRWTAYVLGELADEKDVAEIEAAVRESEEARVLVDEIRGTVGLLAKELQAEPAAVLSAGQRQQIESRIDRGPDSFVFRHRWVIACVAPAAAAILIMFVAHPFAKRDMPAKSAVTTPGPAGLRGAAMIPEVGSPRAASSLPSPSAEKFFAGEAPRIVTPGASGRIEPGAPLQLVMPAGKLSSIAGVLVDQAGGVIPGAKVQVKDETTGSIFKAVTVEDGTFAFPSLKPGEHTLTALMPGFKATVLKGLMLAPGVPRDIRVTMAVGGTNETVTVTAGAETITSQFASINIAAGPGRGPGYGPGVGGGIGAGQGGGGGGGARGGMAGQSVDFLAFRWGGRMDRSQQVIILPPGQFNTEAYDNINDNEYRDVAQKPLSTFSIDVDTASYANLRRFLNNGQLPPKDAVRIEELINYFSYDYLPPNDGKPFAAQFEITEAPWNPDHRLLRIGIKGREMRGSRPACNLVFLLDVSGSMMDANKLPLVKESMRLLLDQLTEDDKVAIVVYSTQARIVLPSTRCDQKWTIRAAIDSLQAGGTTNGAGGIQLAYEVAQQNLLRKGVNRVILATDGDFNVGITNRGDLTRLIEEQRKSGIFLSALGFGMGNLKDSTLELLADKGDGNYAYIDTLNEARKVLVEELNGALVTIAKDVKIQVEFNPAEVSAYRLIGYENRLLRKEDFNDDTKDAGEIGAGHAVTVFYELVPAGQSAAAGKVDPLKYQKPAVSATPAARSGELLTLKIRHKAPDGNESILSEYVVRDAGRSFSAASRDFKFAAAVAAFGMWLRESPFKGRVTMEDIQQWAKQGLGPDPYGYRQEFLQLLSRADSLRQK